jgi:hypothetical protein
MLVRSLFAAAAFVTTLCLSTTVAGAQSPIVTQPIAKPFLVPGMNYIFHIKSIETATPLGKPAFLAHMNDCALGYIMVVASVQNNADVAHFPPGVGIGFELADGSGLSGPQGDGYFVYPSFAQMPPKLYPKEPRDVAFVTCKWTGQPITKILWANRFRINVPAGFVKNLSAPVASPAP